MIINVHAGHNPAGKVACGAVGFLNESIENRRVKDEVISQLRDLGHTVYDCTVDNGSSQSDVLKKIVAKCNAHTVDLDVSIHLNSAANDPKGDGKTAGVEVLIYRASDITKDYGAKVAAEISKMGYRIRSESTSPVPGVKLRPNLYVLKNTKAPAMLIECCFVDDRDDVQLYDCQKMAEAIVYGITDQRVVPVEDPEPDKEAAAPGAETAIGDGKALYKVQVVKQYGAFAIKENAEKMKAELKAAGFDAIIVKA